MCACLCLINVREVTTSIYYYAIEGSPLLACDLIEFTRLVFTYLNDLTESIEAHL